MTMMSDKTNEIALLQCFILAPPFLFCLVDTIYFTLTLRFNNLLQYYTLRISRLQEIHKNQPTYIH